jgi:epoxyqueuosine reductase
VTAEDHDPLGRRELLKRWALEAGFQRAGVAELGPSEQGAAYRDWLDRGENAGMLYLERRLGERFDPRLLLRGAARSALCVALHYFPSSEPTDRDPQRSDSTRDGVNSLWQGVARYATGEDYHRVMERRLWALAERICAAFPGCKAHVYVDTGPVLERELAARAGLGVPAKNTMLLHREGSWFLLGEILLSLELTPDEPLGADLCGSCTRCLDACPTAAFPEPYRLDANRCISYWTIEERGLIPEDLAAQFGGWVFGCDVCQEVCPWNHRLTPVDEPAFALPEARRALDLVDLCQIDRESYVELLRHSPLKRPKRPGLQRNALVALGNLAALDPEDSRRVAFETAWSTALAVYGSSEDPVVTATAAQVLRRLVDLAAPAEVRRELHLALERAALTLQSEDAVEPATRSGES